MGDTVIKQDATNDTAEKLQNAVIAAIEAYTADYEVGEAFTNIPVVTWSWAFEGENAKDTILGNNAATATAATIAYTIKVTATQID